MSEPLERDAYERAIRAQCEAGRHVAVGKACHIRTMPMTGGCACGALRWSAEGEPLTQGVCHCRTCQRVSGSGHVGWLTFPEVAVTITGATRETRRTGGSGRIAARFSCPTCNSTVYGTAEVIAGLLNLYAGSLDDPSQFRPTIAIFVSERPPWDDVSRDLQCFETVPSG